MDLSAYITLAGFVLLMVGTPGPANMVIMLAASQQGLRKTLGFIGGIILGFSAMNILTGLGLGHVLADSPVVLLVLKFVSGGVMIWFALQSWLPESGPERGSSTYNFKTGLIIHPVNPKAWVMLILGWTDFAPAMGPFPIQMGAMLGTFAAIGVIMHLIWGIAGVISGRLFQTSVLFTRALIIVTVSVVLAAVIL